MNPKTLRVFLFFLFAFLLCVPMKVGAELSVTNQWRIEQSAHLCSEKNHTLVYPEYWGDTVTNENRETVCMAEQFARLVAMDGEEWLQGKGLEFINLCKEQSQKDNLKYYKCLETGLKKVTEQLSSSACEELGAEDLWDEARCRRLVSYIFIKDFDQFMLDNRPLIRKAMDHRVFQIIFGPIAAIVILLLYVLDIVLLTDPGNWMRIPTFGFIVGLIILGSWFFEGQVRFIGMGLAVLICAAGIIRNHVMALVKADKKKRRYRGR